MVFLVRCNVIADKWKTDMFPWTMTNARCNKLVSIPTNKILNIKETQSNNLNGTIHLPIVAVGIEYIRGKQIAKTAINAPHKLWETENKYENPITVLILFIRVMTMYSQNRNKECCKWIQHQENYSLFWTYDIDHGGECSMRTARATRRRTIAKSQ